MENLWFPTFGAMIKDKLLVFSVLLFISACSSNNEKEEKEEGSAPEVEVESAFSYPLSGFELSNIVLDSMDDEFEIDSKMDYKKEYQDFISDFLEDPVEFDYVNEIRNLQPIEDKQVKTLLYHPYQPSDMFEGYYWNPSNAQIVLYNDLIPFDTVIVPLDSGRVDTIYTVDIEATLVELSMVSDTSQQNSDLFLKHDITLGMHYNELVSKLGIGFVKNENRMIYHNWKDRIGIFEVDEYGIVNRIIIGHYGIDLELDPKIPNFIFSYVSF